MELIREKDPTTSFKYKKIKEEYSKVIYNITRDENYTKFIGGLPITLEKKDCYNLFSKDINNNYRYSITQKVDGIRVLMFASYKSESSKRQICFVDRENNFYELKNEKNNSLPDFGGTRFLIDGELIIFLKDGRTTNDMSTKYHQVKSYAFMAFDILYGPTRIEYLGVFDNKQFVTDTEGALSGKLGRDKSPYVKRYEILYKLIVPPEIEKKNKSDELDYKSLIKYTEYIPTLTNTFNDCDWFTIELKDTFHIDTLSKKDNNIYKYYEEQLHEKRKKFYELINKTKSKKSKYKQVKLDGLIFTPYDTNYVIGGAWNEIHNVQYKWKPPEEQSIDFYIDYLNGKVILKVIDKDRSLVSFDELIEEEYIIDKFDKVKEGTIGEFTYSKGIFKLKNLRKEKKTPNAKITALNVFRAINNPINLDKLKFFIEFFTTKNEKRLAGIKKRLIDYMPINKISYCYFNNNKNKLFSKELIEKIKTDLELFKQNNDYEFEIRLGYLNKLDSERYNYVTDLSFNLYKKVIDYLGYNNIPYKYSVYHDLSSDGIRSRYYYINEIKSFIHLETIKKNKIDNIDINLKHIFNNDIRFSLSEEEKISTQLTKSDLILEKLRYSFMFNNISIDCTEIINMKTKKKNYQVELEIKNKFIDYNEIISTLLKILTIL